MTIADDIPSESCGNALDQLRLTLPEPPGAAVTDILCQQEDSMKAQ